VPGANATDFAVLARGAGFRAIYAFDSVDAWRAAVAEVFNTEGPAFVVLHVEPVLGLPGPRSPGPAADRARRFTDALQR
jgi:thiamine pyrophosphate-dependent acetolactate synthase large subunit-like protein